MQRSAFNVPISTTQLQQRVFKHPLKLAQVPPPISFFFPLFSLFLLLQIPTLKNSPGIWSNLHFSCSQKNWCFFFSFIHQFPSLCSVSFFRSMTYISWFTPLKIILYTTNETYTITVKFFQGRCTSPVAFLRLSMNYNNANIFPFVKYYYLCHTSIIN